MLVIEFIFLTGRYHATPWDAHVNEGLVEWPPSPWRFLRALVAVYHRKAAKDIEAHEFARLIEALASELPRFRLPMVVSSHTRHYMPLAKPGETRLVFDAFLHPDSRTPLQMVWPMIDLDAGMKANLAVLLDRLGYLGRAEALVEARIAVPADGIEVNSGPAETPVNQGFASSGDDEIVPLLAPQDANSLAAWHAKTLTERRDILVREKQRSAAAKGRAPELAKVTARDEAKLAEGLPSNLVEALEFETTPMRKAGWSVPPGARWVNYRRPRQFVACGMAARPRASSGRVVTVARFALTGSLLPHVRETLSFAERVRTALIKISDGASVFVGRDTDGAIGMGHRHAHLVPEANGSQGRLTHLSIYASMGFDDVALRALHALRRVWGRGGSDIGLIFLGAGTRDEFRGQDTRDGGTSLFDSSLVWRSATPFVCTRHPKGRRGRWRLDPSSALVIGSPEHDLRRLLRARGLPEPITIGCLDAVQIDDRRVPWHTFNTRRRNGDGRRSLAAATGFQIEFPEPVEGPLLLGYAAHFGLGLFLPVHPPSRP